MAFGRLFAISSLNSSSENLRKWTKSAILFVYVFPTLMKFVNWSHVNFQWPDFNYIPFFPSQKGILEGMQEKGAVFSHTHTQNLAVIPLMWKNSQIISKFILINNNNNNVLIKVYLKPSSPLPHTHMWYKLLIETGGSQGTPTPQPPAKSHVQA